MRAYDKLTRLKLFFVNTFSWCKLFLKTFRQEMYPSSNKEVKCVRMRACVVVWMCGFVCVFSEWGISMHWIYLHWDFRAQETLFSQASMQ